jgi:hypothetical protein
MVDAIDLNILLTNLDFVFMLSYYSLSFNFRFMI